MEAPIIVLLIIALMSFIIILMNSFSRKNEKKKYFQELEKIKEREKISFQNGKIISIHDQCFSCQKNVRFAIKPDKKYVTFQYEYFNYIFSIEARNFLSCPECDFPVLFEQDSFLLERTLLLFLLKERIDISYQDLMRLASRCLDLSEVTFSLIFDLGYVWNGNNNQILVELKNNIISVLKFANLRSVKDEQYFIVNQNFQRKNSKCLKN